MANNSSPSLADMFEYLDELRESGVTNMYGAAPYVAEEFDLHIGLACGVLSKWMNTFDKNKTAADRAKMAEAA